MPDLDPLLARVLHRFPFLRIQDLVNSYPHASPVTESDSVSGEVVLSFDRIVASTVLHNIALAPAREGTAFSQTTHKIAGDVSGV